MNTLAHSDVALVWRGALGNDELDDLHTEAFGDARGDQDWASRLMTFSLGWVTARDDGELVGFVNVAWDGMAHAFLLDVAVAPQARHFGVATRLIEVARDQAGAAGCEWLHVDFEERLSDFYFGARGFRPTSAGLIALQPTKRYAPSGSRFRKGLKSGRQPDTRRHPKAQPSSVPKASLPLAVAVG